jgi:DNA-binding NarL/FixJ family response regulator
VSRIVVVDDHPVFRKGLAALLRSDGHDVVAEASDGQEAIALVQQERPDLVLMDLSMPIRDGFEATAHITARHPDTRVVVITLFDDEASVVRALQAGASGYVSKQAEPEQITGAVDAALRGAMWLGAGVARPPFPSQVAEALPALTPRELVIADLVSRGLTNPMIAEQLCLSTKTVANYVSAVMLKLGAANRDEAARTIRSTRSRQPG